MTLSVTTTIAENSSTPVAFTPTPTSSSSVSNSDSRNSDSRSCKIDQLYDEVASVLAAKRNEVQLVDNAIESIQNQIEEMRSMRLHRKAELEVYTKQISMIQSKVSNLLSLSKGQRTLTTVAASPTSSSTGSSRPSNSITTCSPIIGCSNIAIGPGNTSNEQDQQEQQQQSKQQQQQQQEQTESSVDVYRNAIITALTEVEPVMEELPGAFAIAKMAQLCRHVHYLTMYKAVHVMYAKQTSALIQYMESVLSNYSERNPEMEVQLLSECALKKDSVDTLLLKRMEYQNNFDLFCARCINGCIDHEPKNVSSQQQLQQQSTNSNNPADHTNKETNKSNKTDVSNRNNNKVGGQTSTSITGDDDQSTASFTTISCDSDVENDDDDSDSDDDDDDDDEDCSYDSDDDDDDDDEDDSEDGHAKTKQQPKKPSSPAKIQQLFSSFFVTPTNNKQEQAKKIQSKSEKENSINSNTVSRTSTVTTRFFY